jgi:formate/nitrite transporter FocA (FNT family)
MLIVTIVNVISGGLLVALVYWLIYRKDRGTK